MRLHHLRIQAFGPFGGTVDIDFDELNQAGQFLITGATGSGKTSILDAVCFALYGEVPGERQHARHLRSDHAPVDSEPRVTLTLTLAERLIRITRSPAWDRPKRRGVGMTTQQASVRVEQEVDGTWQVLATRLDEAGHLINLWLGMTAVQFTQVALLPQGGFQTFLHAPSATRQAILQRLFRTDRFERVEKWFGDSRRSLNRSRQEALHRIDVITHRIAEAARGTEPPSCEGGIDALDTWVSAQRGDVDANFQTAQTEHDAAALVNAQAADAYDAASQACSSLDRASEATQELRELEESSTRFASELAALGAHERALTLVPLMEAHAEAQAHALATTVESTTTLKAVGLTVDHTHELDGLARQASKENHRAEQAAALATDLENRRAHCEASRARWQASAATLLQLRTTTAVLPDQLITISDRIHAASDAEVELASCVGQLADARRGLNAANELGRVAAELEIKTALRLADQLVIQDLREAYQNAREARIEAMASELAGGLVVGCSCPVCGSRSHPAPATSSTSGGRKIEDRARRRYESASVELTALEEVIAGLKARRDSCARESQGLSTVEWQDRFIGLEERHGLLTASAATLQPLRASELAVRQQLATAQAQREALVQDEAHAQAELHALAVQVDHLENDLATALGEHGDAASFATHAAARCSALESAIASVRRSNAAEDAATRHAATLDRHAAASGFVDGADAGAALLDDDAVLSIASAQRLRELARLAATAVLAEPSVRKHLDTPRPDLEAIRVSATEADVALAQAQAQLQTAAERRERTHAIAREFAKAAAAYRPLAARVEQVVALSGLLEGTGTDNRLRMRLSAFVLAERLRQVIAAANSRLETIGEGRYVLHYREERGAADSRGGLSLSVLDEWTGIRRDPTTLSGGETFVVSLCLALGLADTVADESGGLRIDTLFIDEGFGSLDAQTLDSVIDILGQLSVGGRVTGVVSHLQELRERMPAALEVVPSRSGSTVRVSCA